jgi:hypothetical protein
MSNLDDFKPEAKLNKIKGEITRLSQKETDKGKRYGLRLDNELNGIWLNGFGTAPGTEGDIIELEYEITESNGNAYYNVKKIINIQETHKSVTKKDNEIFKSIPLVDGTNLLAAKYNLMHACVDLSIKRNLLGDKEIYSMYDKLISYITKQEANEDTSGEKNG